MQGRPLLLLQVLLLKEFPVLLKKSYACFEIDFTHIQDQIIYFSVIKYIFPPE